MKIKAISIAAAAVLLISLMPQNAGAATTQKMKTYTVTMTKAHLPAAPLNGTDDYRCFLLDPKVTEDSIIRTIQFIPQRKNYVHHAIIFRVTDADLAEGIKADNNGAGWPCFGGSGLGGSFSTFVSSPWLSSWAPGRGKDVSPPGYGTPFKKGERFVLQVHYNLLAAQGGTLETDQSKIVMETVPAKGASVKQLAVELFPAPVELACPAGVTGPLCDRKQSLIDLAARTSTTSAFEAAGINGLCGQDPFKPTPSLTSRCDKVINKTFNIIAAAPHMHLLGRSLKLTLNPGTSTEKIILNVTNYNFDDQSSTVLKSPIAVKAGDTIRVECTFDPTLRQKIPQLKTLAPRYVTWGEGSSDEMCLGVIAATKG
ncbi:MAG: monooxygenase [Streptomycetaceae bacterium]|nr:MAG: monooxygenase [Streptomycetaceae bacterium]